MSFSLSYQSLHSMSNAFGLLPFQIDRGRTGKILGEHINLSNLVRSSIIILICVASIIFSILELKLKKPGLDQATNVAVFENYIFTSVRYILDIFYVILDTINRKKFVNILKKFDAFDEEVKNNLKFYFRLCNTNHLYFKISKLGVSVDHDKTKKFSIKFIWISIIFLMGRAMITPYLITIFVNQIMESLLIMDIFNIFGQIMQALVLINICTFISGLSLRFECLCQVLR